MLTRNRLGETKLDFISENWPGSGFTTEGCGCSDDSKISLRLSRSSSHTSCKSRFFSSSSSLLLASGSEGELYWFLAVFFYGETESEEEDMLSSSSEESDSSHFEVLLTFLLRAGCRTLTLFLWLFLLGWVSRCSSLADGWWGQLLRRRTWQSIMRSVA